MIRAALTLIGALTLGGCDRPRTDAGDVADRAEQRAAEMTAEDMDAMARLRVAEQRIARLEREVAELQASPTAVDNELLRQRLSATEQALAAGARATAAPEPAPSATPKSKPTPQPTATPRPRPAPAPSPTAPPRLNLVDPKLFDPAKPQP